MQMADLRFVCSRSGSLLSILVFFVVSYITGVRDAVQYIGQVADWRDSEDNVKRAILIIDPSQRVLDDGYVAAWNVYTTRGRRSQYAHLQMWRPVRPADNRYQLVGETVIQALWVGHSLFTLYPKDRIPVRRGDVLGIYFPKYNPIPWSPAPCHGGNEHLFKYNHNPNGASTHQQQQQGQRHQQSMLREISFTQAKPDWNPCRHYSLNATIMNELELAQFDYDYQETTDGRFERRPYGQYRPTRRPWVASRGSRHLAANVNTWTAIVCISLLTMQFATCCHKQCGRPTWD